MEKDREGGVAVLFPILVFLLIFLGSGSVTGDFYSMPAIAAFLIALLATFVQNRELGFTEKIKLTARGVGDRNVITVCLIFLTADTFTGTAKVAGDVDPMVNLGPPILSSNVAVAGLFLIGCFISTSMGTSVGTATALIPIAVGISQKTGFFMAVCVGTVMGGAMFGDNLPMISDTIIAAVKTQGYEMKDKFRENFLIVLLATTATVLSFLVLRKDAPFHIQGSLDYGLLRVVPYMVVLVGALAGVNIFPVLMTGTVLSLIARAATDAFGVGGMSTHVGAGITGVHGITAISVTMACIVALVKEYGGIISILSFIKKRINGERGGELGIAALALLVGICTANNTVAIAMAGSTAEEISDDLGATPRRSASLSDMFSSMGQGLIPYGAQLLAAASLTGLTPFGTIPYCFYPILMGVGGLLFIFIKKRHGKALV